VKIVRVILVEDSPVFRSALSSLLSGCGLSTTISNGTPPCSLQADVVLVDAGTFAKSAELLEELIRGYSHLAPVLLLTREDRLEMLLAGLKGGAVGFVEQSASIKDLQKAIVAVARHLAVDLWRIHTGRCSAAQLGLNNAETLIVRGEQKRRCQPHQP